MSQKSSVPQAASFVSMVLKRDTRDVTCVHAGDRVVHQEFCVDFRYAGCGSYGAKGLAEIISPLREFSSVLLCLRQMTRPAFRWKYPFRSLRRIHQPTKSNGSHKTEDHLARERDIKGALCTTLRFRN